MLPGIHMRTDITVMNGKNGKELDLAVNKVCWEGG